MSSTFFFVHFLTLINSIRFLFAIIFFARQALSKTSVTPRTEKNTNFGWFDSLILFEFSFQLKKDEMKNGKKQKCNKDEDRIQRVRLKVSVFLERFLLLRPLTFELAIDYVISFYAHAINKRIDYKYQLIQIRTHSISLRWLI